jgi:nicotinate-nucleotide adenylyltransferase
MVRIGLYGGCFNPVHVGHLTAARGAVNALGLDRLIFIPSGNPPMKGNSGLADGAHRLAMLDIAIADDPYMEVSPIEIHRNGPSFTVDTVEMLRRDLPADADLFFLLGADCVDRLPQWKGIATLHAMLRFAILPRSGAADATHDDRLVQLDLPQVDASSTQVRAMFAAGQCPPASLLPLAVADYIRLHGLYVSQAERACA